MFIKKIFENQVDETVHKQFIRFSKGQYDRKSIINIKKGPKIKVTTSFELANDIVFFIASLAPKFKVKGILLTKQEIPDIERKKKKDLFNYNIDKDLDSGELKDFVSKAFFVLFDCISQDNTIELKTKKKLPKPGKGSKSKINDKFCQLILDQKYWNQVHDEFLFDLPYDIKKAHIEHSYIINEIKIPKEFEKQRDFEKIRLEAKRAGKIIRKIVVDKKEIVKETEFTA